MRHNLYPSIPLCNPLQLRSKLCLASSPFFSWFSYSLKVFCLECLLINPLLSNLLLRICFQHVFMYVFILWQRQPGVQEEEEEHSMAWRLSLFYTLVDLERQKISRRNCYFMSYFLKKNFF